MIHNLSTDRLRLRDFRDEDVAFLVHLDSTEDVRRYVLQAHPSTDEEASRFIERVKTLRKSHQLFGYWIVEEAFTGEPVGWLHLRESRFLPGLPELGYRFVKSSWGRGYATEASRAVLSVAFAQPSIDEVIAVALPENVASVQVMWKLGMSYREETVYQDVHRLVVYSILKEEWDTVEHPHPIHEST